MKMAEKKSQKSIKFIKPISCKGIPKKNGKKIKLGLVNLLTNQQSRNYFKTFKSHKTVLYQSMFTSIYNNYHLMYANFLSNNKEQTTYKVSDTLQSKQNFFKKKKKKKKHLNLLQKNNGLMLVPNLSIDPGIISNKLKEIVTHSVIANRRIEYSKILNNERLKYINKIVIIQRKWRKYNKKRRIKSVITIHNKYIRYTNRRRFNKECLNILKCQYLLRKYALKNSFKFINEYGKCKSYSIQLYNKFLSERELGNKVFNNQTIQNEIEFDIKSEVKQRTVEQSLKIIANVRDDDGNSHFKVQGGIKTFPRLMTERNLNRIKINRISQYITEDKDEEDIEIGENSAIKKNKANKKEKATSQTNKTDNSINQPVVTIINQCEFYTKINYILLTSKIHSIKTIQRWYHNHLEKKKNRVLKHKSGILFSKLINIIINHKIKYSFWKLLYVKFAFQHDIKIKTDNIKDDINNNYQLQEEETYAQETEKEISLIKETNNLTELNPKSNEDFKRLLNNIKDQILNDTYTSFSKVAKEDRSNKSFSYDGNEME